jgi:Flp pilus assembly protein TadD
MDYLKTQTVVVCEYLRLLVWPTGQNLDYDFPIHRSALDGRVLGSTAILLLLVAFAVWAARRSGPGEGTRRIDPAFRVVAFGIGWFFVTLAVESSVIPIVDVIYEHRAYLPSVGMLTAAATLLGWMFLQFAPGDTARVTVLSGLALALVLGSVTLQRNAVWATPVTLWSDAAAKSPGKARPHLLLAESLEAAGRPVEAEREYRRAVEIDPSYPPAHTSLATFLQKSGRTVEAESEYRTVLRLDATQHAAVFNLAEILWRSGRRDEAIEHYRRFLTLAPSSDRLGRSIASSRAGPGGSATGSPSAAPR